MIDSPSPPGGGGRGEGSAPPDPLFVNPASACILHLMTPPGRPRLYSGIPTMTRKVYIETVGCQMNVLDSELVVGALRRHGLRPHRRARRRRRHPLQHLLRPRARRGEDRTPRSAGVRRHKRDNPDTVIGVLGLHGPEGPGADPQARPVRGHDRRHRASSARCRNWSRRCGPPASRSWPSASAAPTAARHEVEASFESYDPARDPSMRPTPFQAYVRIQIGCDKFCTYCVVPTTRGPEQSRPPEHICGEVRQLADQGCKEVTLLGQTVNSYVYDHGDGRRTRLARPACRGCTTRRASSASSSSPTSRRT